MEPENSNQQNTESQYIAIEDAADELGVNRSTVYYYLKKLNIKPEKFPLDKLAYITRQQLAIIKGLKKSAAERKH